MQNTKKALVYLDKPLKLGLSPPENIAMDKWVEKYVKLPAMTSSEPGPVKLSRTPYLRGIYQAFQSIYVEHLVIVCGRQVGKSTFLFSSLAYAIAQDPGPALFVMDTREMAKYTSTNRMRPLFLSCEQVKSKLTSNPDDFTNMEMRFSNMVLSIVGGNSIAQMISRPVRYLFRDEIDEIVGNVGTSADPLKAAEETTSTFANRKIIDTSTPTTSVGNIWMQLGSCEYVFEYWVPCPECGTKQILLWDRIKYNTDEKDKERLLANVYYECKSCKYRIIEFHKQKMAENGEWRARLSENIPKKIEEGMDCDIKETIILQDVLENQARKIGFHLPKWYGLFYHSTFSNAVREYLEAVEANKEYGDFTKMRDWSQYWAAKPYTMKAATVEEQKILENKINIPGHIVPSGYVALTAGIDMAQKGFWFVIIAWKIDLTCHLVDYGFVSGWDSLTEILWNTAYMTEDSKQMAIFRLGIDTGGTKYQGDTALTMTEACYAWLRANGKGRAYGIKGSSHKIKSGKKMQISVIDKMPKGGKQIPGGITTWTIDTDAFKDALFYKLSLEDGHPGRMTLNTDTQLDYVKHLMAEQKHFNKTAGRYEWVAVSGMNHWLDATIYAMAMADPECNGGVKIIRQNAQPIKQRRILSRGIEG